MRGRDREKLGGGGGGDGRMGGLSEMERFGGAVGREEKRS